MAGRSDTTTTEGPRALSEGDSLDPGNKYYQESLSGAKKQYEDSHGDTLNSNYNADDEDSRAALEEREKNGDSLYRQSGKDSNIKSPQRKTGFLRGKINGIGPSGGIIGLIIFAIVGVGGGTSFLAGSLLINVKEIFHNDRADATRTHLFFSKAMISKSIGYKGAGCGSVAIKCRMGTLSDAERKRYERAGFKIKGEVVGLNGKLTGEIYESPEKYNGTNNEPDKNSRFIAKEITFPDGKTVNTGDGFFKYTAANVKMKVKSLAVFNPRSFFFLGQRFNEMLGKTFKFSKASTLKGTKKEEIDKNFNEKTGGTTEEDAKTGAKKTKFEEEGDKVSKGAKSKLGGKLGGGSAEILTAACTAYNSARYAIAGYKMVRMYQLISFALPWLQAADQIKDQGNISPEIVDNLSSRLTSYESNQKMIKDTDYAKKGEKNPKYGLTATDSQGYAIAAHGDKSALKEFAKVWLLGGNKNSAATKVSDTLNSITTAGNRIDKETGKKGIRTICKALNSTTGALAGISLTVLNCASTIIGNFATGPEGCAVAVAWLAAGVALSAATSVLAEKLVSFVADEAKNFIVGSDLNGVDAGDAIAAGAGLMLGASSVGAGLRPSESVKETQDYISYTDKENNEQIAVERYIARDDPFDIYNKYSFLGSIVRQLQPNQSISNPMFASFFNVYSIVSSTISTGGMASALYNQPALDQKERYDCEDPDLIELKIIGDKYCNIATIMPTEDLQGAEQQANGTRETIDEVIDYMVNPQNKSERDGGTLDDSFGADGTVVGAALDVTKIGSSVGKPNSILPSIDQAGKPTPGSQYALYLKYCTDNRYADESQTTWTGETGAGSYWGTTTKEIEKDSNRDQDWYSGKQCTDPIKSKMMSMFRQYTNYCLQKATMQGTLTCWEEASPAAAVTVGGEWSYPTSCETTKSDSFGTRGGTHQGVDLAGPLGTAIYAARDGKVVASGPASGFGNWIIIQHEVNGKRVDSVYGHMRASDLLVKVGDSVKSGQQISKIGNEGGSTGPHLHFEIWQGGRFGGKAVDPEPIINKYRICV